uniref:NADH-ubiquinone oxidoreductase chain 3 n=1 Tax=Isometopus sp. TaxID=2931297 RepID=A0A8T9ZYG6_9HEMI|nr:NADH dehydrogenase subunit 3 [Isometopus sp.]
MMKITMTVLLSMMISMMLMTLCFNINKKTLMDQEKMSPFECGFDPKSSSRMPFSSQFFLIAVLFLIFDIEIIIIIPMVYTIKTSSMIMWMLTSSMFIVILMMGLFHEWKNGVLEWAV